MGMTQGERKVAMDSAAGPSLTVAAVARRLGVAPSTLRTWDRRYGVGPSAHVAGSHRRYSASDLSRLVVMRRLTLEGIAPAEAALLARTSEEPAGGEIGRHQAAAALVTAVPSSEGGEGAHAVGAVEVVPLAVISAEILAELGGAPVLGPPVEREGDLEDDDDAEGSSDDPSRYATRLDRLSAGGGRVIALPDGSPQARGLARAAMALDTAEVSRLLGDAVRRLGVVRSWEFLARPVLGALADRAEFNSDELVVEHAFVEAVTAVMRDVAGGVRRPRNVRPVLLACAEGESCGLPLHVLAAALAERHVAVRMLGAGVPAGSLVAAVRRCGPVVLVVHSSATAVDIENFAPLRRQRPAPHLVVVGEWWDQEALPAWAHHVEDLGSAVDEVLTAVHL